MTLYLTSYSDLDAQDLYSYSFSDGVTFTHTNRFQLKELENDEGYEISLELPGYKSSQVEAEIIKDTLYVRAKSGNRSVNQSVILPTALDTKKASAKLEDGILTITFGYAEEKKPHRIEIK